MIIFIVIIFSIHFVVNYFIYSSGLHALEGLPKLQMWFRWIMLLMVVAYPAGRFLERIWYSTVSNVLHWIGAFWFAGMLYFTLILLLVQLVRGMNGWFHFFPAAGSPAYLQLKHLSFYLVAGLVVLLVIGGHVNAWTTKINKFDLEVHKAAGELQQLHIVAVSDVHLGTIIGPRKTNKLVRTINDLKPDIVLFAGDVVDEDVGPVIRQNLGENLLKLKAPLGVYASTGNHEYIGGADRSVQYLEEHGIRVLRDSVVDVKGLFYLAGREDKDMNRFDGIKRQTPAALLESVDLNKPIILLDHQPFHLDQAQKAGIDLQISGHTHHGQLWPLNYITQKLFEVSRGYKKKGHSHFIVSTGFGTWGPPVRIGNRPEILDITLHFNPKDNTSQPF
jgi:predicted MPP superfamily phosphohydrolase